MANNFKIVFVHGYTASSKENWYPAISKELEKLGVDYAIPDLPGGEHPKAADWIEAIRQTVFYTNLPLVFVGHSLGTRAILLYLEKYNLKVKAVFLIAAFANKLENATKFEGEDYPDFFSYKVDIEKIKNLSEKFVVVHSKDDDLEYAQGTEIAGQLGAKLITFEDKGHMSGAENAPVILDILRTELGF